MARKSRRKTNQNLNRNSFKQEEYRRVLIVCEDSVSSPNYFKDLIKDEKLSSANVAITGKCGSDPVSVVNKAIELYKTSINDKKPASDFDEVFCVIDRDAHANFEDALHRLNDMKNEGKPFHWVASYPCFEYWYLCHFKKVTQPIVKAGQTSSGKNCEKLLNEEWKKKFCENYDKGKSQSYALLKNDIETAIRNAEQTLKSAISVNEMNPSTQVHELVRFLLNLKSSKVNIEYNENGMFKAILEK